MLRYWSSLRYSSLRTLFLLADELRRQPSLIYIQIESITEFSPGCWDARNLARSVTNRSPRRSHSRRSSEPRLR